MLVTIGSRIRAFDWYRHRGPWITLDGVVALILLYFTELDSSACLLYVTVVEGRPIGLHCRISSSTFG